MSAALLLLLISVVLVIFVHGVAAMVQVSGSMAEQAPFLSGAAPIEHAVSRFHVRWYTIAIVFIVFDMEMVFMYPWVLVVRQTGAGSVIEMFAFLAVLVAAVIYAWREGVFRWT